MRLFGNKYVNVQEGRLYLADFDPLSLESSQIPSIIMLGEKIAENIQKIQSYFHEVFPNAQGFYSTKSNFLLPILEIVKAQHFGAEIVSLKELDLLAEIEFPSEKIIAGGPYLPDAFLYRLIESKVRYLVVYSLEDLIRVGKTSSVQNYTQFQILLRFRSPKFTARHGILNDAGVFPQIKAIFDSHPNLKFSGLLSHMGSRMKTLENYMENMNYIVEIIHRLQEVQLTPEIINIGGGFPNADALKHSEFHPILTALKAQLDQILISYQLFYEPGRNIVADAGFAVAEVFGIDPPTNSVFVNLGNNFIPKFMKTALRFYNLNKMEENPNTPMDIMGYIPSDQDILAKNYNFSPSVAIGDKILIANIGAYALTWSTRFPYYPPQIYILSNDHLLPTDLP